MKDDVGYNYTFGMPLFDQWGYLQLFIPMLEYYTLLGLTNIEMMALIHVTSFHYNSEQSRGARPSLGTIATRMDFGDASYMSKVLRGIEAKGLLNIYREPGKPNRYDFSPFAWAVFRLWFTDQDPEAQDRLRDTMGGTLSQGGVVRQYQPPLYLSTTEEEKKEDQSKNKLLGDSWIDGYDEGIYYRDKSRVTPLGRVHEGPWRVTCSDCGTDVDITELNVGVGCLCGFKRYTLWSLKSEVKADQKDERLMIYRRIVGRWPDQIDAESILATVEDTDKGRHLWQQVVIGYNVQPGWDPRNVTTMLEWYRNGAIPGVTGKDGANGKRQTAKGGRKRNRKGSSEGRAAV